MGNTSCVDMLNLPDYRLQVVTFQAESIVSWEYDEVTDISEDSQSQAESYQLQYKVAGTKALLSNRSVSK